MESAGLLVLTGIMGIGVVGVAGAIMTDTRPSSVRNRLIARRYALRVQDNAEPNNVRLHMDFDKAKSGLGVPTREMGKTFVAVSDKLKGITDAVAAALDKIREDYPAATDGDYSNRFEGSIDALDEAKVRIDEYRLDSTAFKTLVQFIVDTELNSSTDESLHIKYRTEHVHNARLVATKYDYIDSISTKLDQSEKKIKDERRAIELQEAKNELQNLAKGFVPGDDKIFEQFETWKNTNKDDREKMDILYGVCAPLLDAERDHLLALKAAPDSNYEELFTKVDDYIKIFEKLSPAPVDPSGLRVQKKPFTDVEETHARETATRFLSAGKVDEIITFVDDAYERLRHYPDFRKTWAAYEELHPKINILRMLKAHDELPVTFQQIATMKYVVTKQKLNAYTFRNFPAQEATMQASVATEYARIRASAPGTQRTNDFQILLRQCRGYWLSDDQKKYIARCIYPEYVDAFVDDANAYNKFRYMMNKLPYCDPSILNEAAKQKLQELRRLFNVTSLLSLKELSEIFLKWYPDTTILNDLDEDDLVSAWNELDKTDSVKIKKFFSSTLIPWGPCMEKYDIFIGSEIIRHKLYTEMATDHWTDDAAKDAFLKTGDALGCGLPDEFFPGWADLMKTKLSSPEAGAYLQGCPGGNREWFDANYPDAPPLSAAAAPPPAAGTP